MHGDGGQVRLIGAAAIALAAAFGGCRPADGGDALADDGSAANGSIGARVVNVEVMQLAPESFVDYVRITGEVEAFHDITISAEETGTILGFAVEKGARVANRQ